MIKQSTFTVKQRAMLRSCFHHSYVIVFLQRSSIGNRYSNLGNDLNPLISPRSQQPPVGSATSNHSSSLFMNNTPGNGAGSTGYVCIHAPPN